MTSDLRFGVVGTGRMAATMVRAMAATPGVAAAAVCSSDPARARAFAAGRGLVACDDVAALLARPDVEAVYVAGRPADHAAPTVAALRAGKPVLCEKPFAADEADAARILDAAAQSGTLFMEALWTLTLPSAERLRALLRSGDYGAPVLLRFAFGNPIRPDSHPGLFDPRDGGAALDRAVYGVALALDLLGPVEAMTREVVRDARGVDLTVAMQLRHAGGACAQIAVSLAAAMENDVSLACSGGVLGLGPSSIGAETVRAKALAPLDLSGGGGSGVAARAKAALRRLPLLRRLNAARAAPKAERHPWGADPYAPLLTHFADLARRGVARSPLAPPELSRETLRLCLEARAARDGG